MFRITLMFVFCFVAIAAFGVARARSGDRNRPLPEKAAPYIVSVLCAFLSTFFLASTSYVMVGPDETAHLNRKYFAAPLPTGKIIAVEDEDGVKMGPQAEILGPGFHLSFGINVLNDVRDYPIIEVKDGEYGFLVAHDGEPFRGDQALADAFPEEDIVKMITDTRYFLQNKGQKGPQTSVLTPGRYRINHFQWEVTSGEVTEIHKGFVGVVKSNVHSRVDFGNIHTAKPTDCSPSRTKTDDGQPLPVPLVPVGCIGIWDQALAPGQYYLNRKAFNVTMVDTRIQTWEYKGGYTKRMINLTVSDKGEIVQEPDEEKRPYDPNAYADEAVFIKVEGWDIPQELRALVQVTPENAPVVVALVGDLDAVENRILTPAIRSIIRNVGGGTITYDEIVNKKAIDLALQEERGAPAPIMAKVTRPTRALDLIENRSVIEANVEDRIRPEGRKAGVEIKEVRFGETAIPPELLVARRREQLANQLTKAFNEERTAQHERIATEKARATADQQSELVKAEIAVQRAEQKKQADILEGEGQQAKLEAIAKGQKAQASVLGEDRVVELRKFEVTVDRGFDFLEKNPGILQAALENAQKFVPETMVSTGDGGLMGPATILGKLLSSNAIGNGSPK